MEGGQVGGLERVERQPLTKYQGGAVAVDVVAQNGRQLVRQVDAQPVLARRIGRNVDQTRSHRLHLVTAAVQCGMRNLQVRQDHQKKSLTGDAK